jgi:nucleoside-diphosphate-sugar epimerase
LAFVWRGKRVLVFGGHSFLGAHLCRYLTDLGAETAATRREAAVEEPLKRDALAQLLSGTRLVEWAGGEEPTADLLRTLRPEVVFHSIGLVNARATDLDASFEANTLSVWNVLRAAASADVRPAVVYSSTDKVYGECRGADETTPLNPGGVYQTTKVCADLLAQMLLRELALSGAILRSSNFYGPLDWHRERLIRPCILACLRDEPIRLRGDGSQVREYVYVEDVVRGFAAAAERALGGAAPTVYNLTSGDARSAREVATLVRTCLDSAVELDIAAPGGGELSHQSIDDSRARRDLDWDPGVDLAEGIARTAASYEAVLKSVRS